MLRARSDARILFSKLRLEVSSDIEKQGKQLWEQFDTDKLNTPFYLRKRLMHNGLRNVLETDESLNRFFIDKKLIFVEEAGAPKPLFNEAESLCWNDGLFKDQELYFIGQPCRLVRCHFETTKENL